MELIATWEKALDFVQKNVPEQQWSWFNNLPNPSKITDKFFLSELAWCIYNSGMKESVVRKKWPDIEVVFHFFDADDIVFFEKEILEMIRPIFNHQRKARAVVMAAKKLQQERPIKNKLANMTENEALSYFESFPYIGKVTRYHLARNVGYDVVKPDRHLVRLGEMFNTNPFDLVEEISTLTGSKKGFIDYVFWQWLAMGGKV